jgi:hypothetical protein
MKLLPGIDLQSVLASLGYFLASAIFEFDWKSDKVREDSRQELIIYI